MVDCITFRMDRNGKMVPCQNTPELQRGHLLYAYGYANNLQMFAVLDGKARTCIEIGRTIPTTVNDLPDSYFSARQTYDKHSEPHSKKFGIGFYYADNGEELATEEQIQEGIERADAIERLKNEAKEIAERAFNESKKEARKNYGSYLNELGSDWGENRKIAGSNLRALLKKKFPGAKFSVRMSGHSSDYYYVNWNDGPTYDAVRKAVSVFDDQVRDRYNDDLWEHQTTGFTALYGSLSVLCQRDFTPERLDEMQDKLHEIFELDDYKHYDGCKLLNAQKAEVPEEIVEVIKESNGLLYSVRDWASAILHHTDFSKKNEDTASEQIGGVKIVDYSEKAVAVIGNTRGISDKLKGLGGRFNSHLSCGAGWIFSKRKENELREVLAL